MEITEALLQEARAIMRKNMRDAIDRAKSMIIARADRGMGTERRFSDYGRSHKWRRQKEGLQTQHKDLQFSGTMFKNITEKWDEGFDEIRVQIDFGGEAHRRPDQKQRMNKDIAVWFEEREGQKILSLTGTEKKKIEETFSVTVHD